MAGEAESQKSGCRGEALIGLAHSCRCGCVLKKAGSDSSLLQPGVGAACSAEVAKEIKQLLARSVDEEKAGGLLVQATDMPQRSMQRV
jgi:hypothetical protein